MAKNHTCELNINVCFWPWCVFVQGKLTASAVGQIVGLQSEEIKQIASEYAEKVRNHQHSHCRADWIHIIF